MCFVVSEGPFVAFFEDKGQTTKNAKDEHRGEHPHEKVQRDRVL